MDSNLRERKSELASAEASEDAVRGKGSVEERPLFLFFAPLPPLSHGGRALCWIRWRSNIHTWENDGQKKYISEGKFIFSLSLSFSQVWIEIPRGRDGL